MVAVATRVRSFPIDTFKWLKDCKEVMWAYTEKVWMYSTRFIKLRCPIFIAEVTVAVVEDFYPGQIKFLMVKRC